MDELKRGLLRGEFSNLLGPCFAPVRDDDVGPNLAFQLAALLALGSFGGGPVACRLLSPRAATAHYATSTANTTKPPLPTQPPPN